MSTLSSGLIAKLKSEVKIEEIISSFLPLQKKGKYYFALCPFHDDHNPSLCIDTHKQLYYCGSCGAHGDVIEFVRNYCNLDFIQAYKKVVEIANLSDDFIKDLKQTPVYEHYTSDQKFIQEMNKRISEYTEYQLRINTDYSYDYISNRKISNETITEFRLGYLSNVKALTDFLMKKYSYSEMDLLKNEFFSQSETTMEIGSKFHHRLMIPIFDKYNSIVGFGGRIINGRDASKYVNSRESLSFHKSEILYNISNAKTHIFRSKEVYVVEGYFDAMALYSNGYKNVVALMNKVLTDEQLQFLNSIKGLRIHLCLDKDAPGIAAMRSIIDSLQNNYSELEIDVCDYKDAKDPGELLESNAVDQITQFVTPFEFLVDIDFSHGRIGYMDMEKKINYLLEYNNKIPSPLQRMFNIKILEEATGFDRETLMYQANFLCSTPDISIPKNKQLDKDVSNVLKGRRILNG